MAEIHARHWHRRTSGWSLRAAIVFSVAVHLAVFSLALINWRSAQPKAIPISFDMQFVSPPTPNPDPEAKPTKAPPPPKKVEPKPEKKKEEPKKEPEKKPEKKPEPKPEKPKKKEPEKKPEKKVEKKPEPKKETKKEPEKKSEPVPTQSKMPAPEVVAKTPPSAGVQQQQLPPLLNMWGRMVQRKVAPYWIIPGGVPLTPENREVQITFWVERNGTLLGQPTADKPLDSPLVQSCIQAIVNAQPLPPLPLEFVGDRQQVVYVFSLTDAVAAGGGTG